MTITQTTRGFSVFYPFPFDLAMKGYQILKILPEIEREAERIVARRFKASLFGIICK